MIGQLTGIIRPLTSSSVIVAVGGVGYKVAVPPGLMARVKPGASVTLHIHTHVREDALDLYGFEKLDELSLFELLLSVAGIGPKTALIVTDRGVAAVVAAVTGGDVEFFTTIPRLGRKNAQKIIIELKNKLGSTKDLDLSQAAEGETKHLIDALASMGFDRREIVSAIKLIEPTHATIEQKIRRALQLMGKPAK
jgi:Holliday junction DNA helicase RuvA